LNVLVSPFMIGFSFENKQQVANTP
jgi:hypothetical protein